MCILGPNYFPSIARFPPFFFSSFLFLFLSLPLFISFYHLAPPFLFSSLFSATLFMNFEWQLTYGRDSPILYILFIEKWNCWFTFQRVIPFNHKILPSIPMAVNLKVLPKLSHVGTGSRKTIHKAFCILLIHINYI